MAIETDKHSSEGRPSGTNDQAVYLPPVRFTVKDWRIWAASFGFFSSLFACDVISMYTFQRLGGTEFMKQELFILPLIQDSIFALLAPFVFVIAARHPIQGSRKIRQGALFLAGGAVFTAMHALIRLLVYPAFNYQTNAFQWSLINWSTLHLSIYWPAIRRLVLWNLVALTFTVYIPIIVIAHAVLYYMRYREKEIRAAQLQTQLSDARLLALKSQLQPHFLFNTLHSISSLMFRDVHSADSMIARLSDLLRMSLEDEGQHLISLKRELDLAEAYLDIEKIRLGDRLAVTVEVPSELLDVSVPHFLLQPLIENSIKHGISKRSSGGQIAIKASATAGRLRLIVRDNGTGEPRGGQGLLAGSGVGLRGTRERLQTLYGNQHRLETNFLQDGSVEITISLPLVREARLISHGSGFEGVVAFGQP